MIVLSNLGEIGDFVRTVIELFRNSPPEAVVVVMAGSALLGYWAHVLWSRLRGTKSEPDHGPCRKKISDLEVQVGNLNGKLARYTRVVEELEKDDADLWRLHAPKPPEKLAERLRASRTKIVLVGHLKGGVSKTTLLANLTAYFDGKGKRVLAIDFDYQGSLTTTLIRAAGKKLTGPYSDLLIAGKIAPEDLLTAAEVLHPLLSNSSLIPASYRLTLRENQQLIRWLLDGGETDTRYILAELLLSPELQNAYDLVLIDMGPRLTTASVCALAACTHVIVPTILDQLSAEAVGSFLSQIRALTGEMKTGLNAVSVVGTMTRQQDLSQDNKQAIAIIQGALQKWDGDAQMLLPNIPFKQSFINCAGTDIAMLKDPDVKELFDELGAVVSRRIGL